MLKASGTLTETDLRRAPCESEGTRTHNTQSRARTDRRQRRPRRGRARRGRGARGRRLGRCDGQAELYVLRERGEGKGRSLPLGHATSVGNDMSVEGVRVLTDSLKHGDHARSPPPSRRCSAWPATSESTWTARPFLLPTRPLRPVRHRRAPRLERAAQRLPLPLRRRALHRSACTAATARARLARGHADGPRPQPGPEAAAGRGSGRDAPQPLAPSRAVLGLPDFSVAVIHESTDDQAGVFADSLLFVQPNCTTHHTTRKHCLLIRSVHQIVNESMFMAHTPGTPMTVKRAMVHQSATTSRRDMPTSTLETTAGR